MHQRRITNAVLILVVASIACPAAAAQSSCDIAWSQAARISPDSSVPTLPVIAFGGGVVHLAWFGLDTTAGGTLSRSGLCYARSTDSGASFSEPLKLLSPFESVPGQLAARGDTVYITAGAFLGTFYGVVLFRSTDAGATWAGPAQVLAGSFPELLFTRGGELFIGYREIETSGFGLIRSVDGGATWQQLARRIRELSAIVPFGNTLFAVGPAPGASQTEAGFYDSQDSGRSWFGPTIISREDLVRSSYPGIAVNDGGILSAAWTDTGTVVYRDSRNGGISWGALRPLSDEPGSLTSRIAADAEFVAVAWDRDDGGTRGVRVRTSGDAGETFCPAVSPDSDASAKEPAIVLVDSVLHIAWIAEPGGVGGIYYRSAILPRSATSGLPTGFSLRQSYPNPTNGSARIAFDLPEDADVAVRVFNVLGELLMTPVLGSFARGRYDLPVEVGALPSGVYFYRLTAGGFEGVGRMVVLR